MVSQEPIMLSLAGNPFQARFYPHGEYLIRSTETLLRLLLPLGGRVQRTSQRQLAETANYRQSERFTSTPNR